MFVGSRRHGRLDGAVAAMEYPTMTLENAPIPVSEVAAPAGHGEGELPRVLRPLHLWAIAVGLVISGDYFGWNLGMARSGPVGMAIAVGLVSLMYVCFIFSYTELSTSIPHSGGPYAYARRALGPFFGLLAGIATLIEFLFAPPAIALAIGSYVHFREPRLGEVPVAVVVFAFFALLNCLGVALAATFELVVTSLAVFELGVFFCVTGPHVRIENLVSRPLLPAGFSGVLDAVPFAIWFYLALEGVAMSAEEVRNPQRDIPRGFTAGLLTLVLLATGTLVCATGVLPVTELAKDDSPLPRAMAAVLPRSHWLTHMMVYLGLFGLLASFHGIMMGYSRQVYALSRGGYLPPFLSFLHPKRKTPVFAVIIPAIVGLLVVWLDKTEQAITLSSIGATVLYVVSMISLLVLRKREPDLRRPFLAPLFPFFPAIALSLALLCLFAVVSSQPWLALLALGFFVIAVLYYLGFAKDRVAATTIKV